MPEVLSVCSVQFKAVCDAIRNGRDRVVVEGDEVTLDVTCGTFITMNPGYLGRSELPGEQAQQLLLVPRVSCCLLFLLDACP